MSLKTQSKPRRYAREARCAFKATVPVLFGYLALGMAMGMLGASKGLPPWMVLLMSLIMYAGSGQIAAVGFLSSGMDIFTMAAITFFINFRHVFYGLPFIKRFAGNKMRLYMIFALTDESYALLNTSHAPEGCDGHTYDFLVMAFNQFYWVASCLAGSLIGTLVHFNTKGLDFSLNALFIVLLIDQIEARKSFVPFLVGGIAIALSLLLIPSQALIVALILSVVALMALKRRVDVDA